MTSPNPKRSLPYSWAYECLTLTPFSVPSCTCSLYCTSQPSPTPCTLWYTVLCTEILWLYSGMIQVMGAQYSDSHYLDWWVAYLFSSRSSQPRNQTGVSCIAGGFLTNWAMREAHRASLVVLDSLNFCLSVKLLISFVNLNWSLLDRVILVVYISFSLL